MQIVIGGDLVPTQSNVQFFIKGDMNILIGEKCQKILKESDFNIFNLECPLCSKFSPIAKCGPNLMAPIESIFGIAKLPASIVGLANNHILDQGWQGLEQTMNVLSANKISYLGAGKNFQEARKPIIIGKYGLKVGLYACAEHEFSIATENSGGANPFNALDISDEIVKLKRQCDHLIVLYHGGKEYYRYPSPMLQKRCRKMIEKGADLVICQHSHCIGCREEYQRGKIIYGQGNFIFDRWPMSNPFTYSSFLLKVDVGSELVVTEIPIIRYGSGIHIAEGSERENILHDYRMRSKAINDENFLQNEYKKFAVHKLNEYLSVFLGKNLILRGVNKIMGHRLVSNLLNQNSYLMIQNFLECEAHHELFLNGIKNRAEKLGK